MDKPFDDTYFRNLFRSRGLEPSERDLLLFEAGRLFERGYHAPDFSEEQGKNIVRCSVLIAAIAEGGL